MIHRDRSTEELLREGEAHLAAGKLAQAEALARELLAAHAGHPRAHFLAAACALRQERYAEALPHLEAALKRDRTNAQYHFLAGTCHEALQRDAEAIECYRRCTRYLPAFAEGHACLGRALQRAARHAEAASAFRSVLALQPNDPRTLTMLGMCELGLGKPEAGLPLLQRGLDLQRDISAEMLTKVGESLIRMGYGGHAIKPLRRATELDPASAKTWTTLAEQLYLGKDDAGALECLDRALAIAPDEFAAFLRDAILGRNVEHPPEAFVSGFFDRFAGNYDRRLQDDLGYRVPEAMAQLVAPWLAGRSGLRVVDLGCGTGLCGALLRGSAESLVGIDLSQGMLDQAHARGIYDELHREDLAQFLGRTTAASIDLAIAADVFVYVGRLEDTLRQCAAALAPGGALFFSIEHLDDAGGDLVLARTGRYSHSCAYISRLAAEYGLDVGQRTSTTLRMEGGQPVAGWLFMLGKPFAAQPGAPSAS